MGIYTLADRSEVYSRAMLLCGCSGFPVPATKYFKEYQLVEIADTFLGVPGPALVRRWRREAPPGFVFTALAPRELTLDAFKPTAAGESAWESFIPVARDLDAQILVVLSPPECPSSKTTRAAARSLLERFARPGLPPMFWEPPPSWELKESETVVKDLPVRVIRDPLRHPAYSKAQTAYYRLPGPAGHRSRYEDPPLVQAAKTVNETRSDNIYAVFSNVDMYSDSKRFMKALEH
jgi:uncharacterized protein YecE (DUF72 family)